MALIQMPNMDDAVAALIVSHHVVINKPKSNCDLSKSLCGS